MSPSQSQAKPEITVFKSTNKISALKKHRKANNKTNDWISYQRENGELIQKSKETMTLTGESEEQSMTHSTKKLHDLAGTHFWH